MNVGDLTETSLIMKMTKTFHIEMVPIIKMIEKVTKHNIPLAKIRGKLIRLANVVLKVPSESWHKLLTRALKGKIAIPYAEEYKLFGTVPKYITFTLDYGKQPLLLIFIRKTL